MLCNETFHILASHDHFARHLSRAKRRETAARHRLKSRARARVKFVEQLKIDGAWPIYADVSVIVGLTRVKPSTPKSDREFMSISIKIIEMTLTVFNRAHTPIYTCRQVERRGRSGAMDPSQTAQEKW